MNRKFIFAFLLLVTLTMVNAIPHKLLKRTTTFNACPPAKEGPAPPLLQVSLSPDPPVAGQNDKITVSGKFSEDVTDKDLLVIAFIDQNVGIIGTPTIVPACTESGCPIKAGEQYTQTVDVQVPAKLPNPYLLGVGVASQDGSDVLGCAIATI